MHQTPEDTNQGFIATMAANDHYARSRQCRANSDLP